MKEPRLEKAGDGRWRLTGPLNLDTVSGLLGRLDDALRNGGESTVLDLEGVTRCDSAAVALLLEWRRRARAAGVKLRYENLPENLLAIARISDAEGFLTEA